jgi:hypothetical protein
MKKILLVLTVVLLWNALPMLAQEKSTKQESTYRRSSLHTILLETGDFLNKDMVMKAYNMAPFPDKYNDHKLAGSVIRLDDYVQLTPEEQAALSDTAAAAAGDDKEKDSKREKLQTQAIETYFQRNKIANQMVAKWFDRDENGAFDMDMIHERGSYDATEMAAQIAQKGIRGLASLKDAGEELISNTFIVVNKMSFVENEPIARAVKEAAYVGASYMKNAMLRQATEMAADAAYKISKDGYSVWTISYLYQLNWNEDIANNFYMNMWMDSTSLDPNKKMMFDTTTMFTMKYVGFAKAKSVILVAIGKETEAIIQQATVRNIDKTYTKLQKGFDVFKTKTPIYSTDPVVMAKIGMKEGVEPGDKFEVLEMVWDQKTQTTKYAQVAIVKAEKGMIWDNRFNMGVPDAAKTEGDEVGNPQLEGTHFKGGGKNVMSGMLLRQVK